MASCPKCGFDLSPDGTCSVCGYGKASKPKPAAVTTRRRRALIAGGIAVVCLLVAAGVFLISGGIGRRQPAALTSAKTQAPATPAASSAESFASSVPAKTPQGSRSAAKQTLKSGPVHAAAATPAPTRKAAYDAAKYEDNPYYRVAVGASPVAVRASKPINLYDPAKQPVYNITDRTQFPPLTSEKAYIDWMLAHTDQSRHFLQWRWQRAQIIVNLHLITHRRVLMAFLLTPREWFVRSYNLDKTYANTAIPIGFGQTISGPELVAHMTDALDPRPNERVLEIGTGSGYQSAVLSELSNYVYTIEIVKPLAEQTNEIYLEHTKAQPQYANIHRRAADGYYGWPRYAPFDRIIVTTGIDHIPPILLQELKPGGIMLIPIGPPTGQVVLMITKTVGKDGQIHLTRSNIYHTPGGHREIFVPFTAAGGGTHNLGSQKRTAD